MMISKFQFFLRSFFFAVVFLYTAVSAQAQTPGEVVPTSLNLSKPASAPKIGDITVPFGWDIRVESDDRIVAVEPSNAPAVITVDMIGIPTGLDATTVANNIVLSLAEALGNNPFDLGATQKSTLCLDEKASKKCKNQVMELAASIDGKEDGNDRTCHIVLYTAERAGKIIAFSLCGPKAKTYTPEPIESLKAMFQQMH